MDYRGMNVHTLREAWEFEYNAGVLAEAAYKKELYEESRVAWWEEKKAELMTEIKETGLEIVESVAAGYSTANSSNGPQVMVRTDLQKKLNECHGKIKQHTELAREYDAWQQVLIANKNSNFMLKHGDWLFFFGRD